MNCGNAAVSWAWRSLMSGSRATRNRKSIFPLQPTGVGSKSGWTPTSNVPVEPAAVLAAESSLTATGLELVELELVSELLVPVLAGSPGPPENVDEASPLRAHADAVRTTSARRTGRRRSMGRPRLP